MILNFSEAFNIAIHALVYLVSRADNDPVSTAQVADSLGVSEAHLSKVFQRLARARLVKAVRGPRGGFRLARPAASINLLEIHQTIDGKVLNEATCLLEDSDCTRNRCVFGNLLSSVNAEVSDYFKKTTLADLAE